MDFLSQPGRCCWKNTDCANNARTASNTLGSHFPLQNLTAVISSLTFFPTTLNISTKVKNKTSAAPLTTNLHPGEPGQHTIKVADKPQATFYMHVVGEAN